MKTHYQGNPLSGPTPGHVYQTELRVHWNGDADVTLRPGAEVLIAAAVAADRAVDKGP
ncbi:hypothetical protein [Streptomyces sp. NPDC037389]|uniref:hypothetical protein n=1 Tax=Streptomyces sp. NPDC037389 TaxID=3155369 RepID=UPI0033F7C5F5